MGEKWNTSGIDNESTLKTALHPGSGALRKALRRNLVALPSRIPVLLKQPAADVQWRMVLLFFVLGWSSARIAVRFEVPKHQVKKALREWSIRAMALGYVQIIDPEAFAKCCRVDVEYDASRRKQEVRPDQAGSMRRHAIQSLTAAAAHTEGPSVGSLSGAGASPLGLPLRDEERVCHAVV